jgi:hypothetical protein
MVPGKKETVQKAYDGSFVLTPLHHSCSLGTLLALQEAFVIKDESAFRAASGLRGGIGRKGNICGSFLGASLMIGLMCGGSIAESGLLKSDPEAVEPPVRLVAELYDWFQSEFGCHLLCGKTAARAAEMLWDELHKEIT